MITRTRTALPDERGHFGLFGGRYVAETLMPALHELERAYAEALADPSFGAEYDRLQMEYVGRPSPLTFAPNLTKRLGGAKVYLKREDLNHTGSHKINNCIGQALLAQRMGKKRIIAETGAGQHGVASATVAARFGMTCDVYMGSADVTRQSLNVFRMKLLGSRVIPVESGTRTLKDALNEALRDWVTNVYDTYYMIGTVAGPHPYPMLVRDFQRIIGDEVRSQVQDAEGRLPDAIVACVGGGSNAMGVFYPFIEDRSVRLVGVEAAGDGVETGRHAASIVGGAHGVLHGSKSFVLQDRAGQIAETHSISAGLDYPGVGPEHAWLAATGRAEYVAVTDLQALSALELLARTEGIIPALESAHAVAAAVDLAPALGPERLLVINVSGRGDKDMQTVAQARGVTL